MSAVIQAVVVVGGTAILIIQTIRGKINWLKFWNTVSKQKIQSVCDDNSKQSFAQDEKYWGNFASQSADFRERQRNIGKTN